MASKKTARKKPAKTSLQNVVKGKMYITATFNNTIATFTDIDGKAVTWGSTGSVGFSGSKKSTPYAATMAITKVG